MKIVDNKTHTVVCHDRNGEKIEIESDKLNFRPSVYGILIENNNVLLSKQWDGYDFPGGGVELHETIEDALKREFWEETGLKIEVQQPVFCGTSFFNPNYSKKNEGQHWNCPLMYFLVQKIGGEISTAHLSEAELEYAGKAEWIDLNTVNNLKFYNAINSVSVVQKAKNIMTR